MRDKHTSIKQHNYRWRQKNIRLTTLMGNIPDKNDGTKRF